MIADLIFLATAHPFVTGLLVGAVGIGAPVGVIGFCVGHDVCARSVWCQLEVEREDATSNVLQFPGNDRGRVA